MNAIDKIKHELALYGACGLEDKITDWESVVDIMFSPQGREFMKKTGYPTLEVLRKYKRQLNRFNGIFIDTGKVLVTYPEVFIAGNTRAEICANEPNELYKVIAMHGAIGEFHATNYAVGSVSVSTGAKVMVDADITSKISVE